MEGMSWLLLLCASMFAGSYLAGLLPLSLPLSSPKTKRFSLLGAGLLVGTALIVIIPEGVQMLYEDSCKAPASVHDDTARRLNSNVLVGAARLQAHPTLLNLTDVVDVVHPRALAPIKEAGDADDTATGTETKTEEEEEEEEGGHDHGHDHSSAHQHEDAVGHWRIGAALALGFAFQVVVHRLAGNLHSHSHGEAERTDVEEGLAVRRSASSESKSVSALVGLCVHAFCDGIALGSAMADPTSGTAISSVALLVFLAIMLHKGPSSFGLTTYLITQGMGTAGVQTRLFLFSLAAPIGTVVTYLLLSTRLFAYSRDSIAICMLFSGGTFLYVATAHILPEVTQNEVRKAGQDDDDHSAHAHANGHGHLSWVEVGYLVAGVLLPLVMNIGHSH